MSLPTMNLMNFGMMTVVELKLTWYTISSGRDAIVGKRSLYRHFRSRTSSAKPSRTMQQMDNSAAMNSTNCGRGHEKTIFTSLNFQEMGKGGGGGE